MSANLTRFIRSLKQSRGLYVGSYQNEKLARKIAKEERLEKERHAEILVENELYERGRVNQLLFESNGILH